MKRNINEIIERPEYSFLKTEERLGSNICLLTFGGSTAYGLDGPQSDIDIRGITMPTKKDLLGASFIIDPEERKNKNLIFGKDGFEQYLDVATDTTVYVLDKIVKLLYKCNPNTIEILGCRPEHYALISPAGQKLLDNKHLFLSQMAYDSFAGYARGQFQRLKNALGNGGENKLGRVISLADSINRMQSHLETSYPGYSREMIKLSIKDSHGNDIYINDEKVKAEDIRILFIDKATAKVTNTRGELIPDDDDIQLIMDIHMDGIQATKFSSVANEVISALKEFNAHIGHRNNKKDDYHLNKHAMHLVRLYLMAKDILSSGEIITYREKEHDFLMSIKEGYYMNDDDRSFKQEFFDLIDKYEKELEEVKRTCKLPVTPDLSKINDMLIDIYSSFVV